MKVIEKLHALHEAGALSKEEFEAKKAQLLAKIM
ncbi:MAG: SHOCT domain-containing protein [Pseudomonadota bacterium]